MFLERCGKLFFSQMRPLFFYILTLFPLISSVAFLILQNMSIQDMEERFTQAIGKGKIATDRKAKKDRFLLRYSQAEPYFLDHQIESLTFLQKEKDRLSSLLSHPALPDKAALKERLAYIEGEQNRLVFTEENIRTSAQVIETDEKQRFPIQIDEDDLQKLLSLIEDMPVGNHFSARQGPQLIVRDLKLKKISPLQTEVFEAEFDLLKREFGKP